MALTMSGGNEPAETIGFSVFTETSNEPDLHRLSMIARNSGGRAILLAVLEETGIAPTQDQAEMSAEATTLRRTAETRVDMTFDDYRKRFWEDFEHREGKVVDAVNDLYDSTEDFADTPLLRTFDRLFYHIAANSHLHDAEAVARLMIEEESWRR